MSYNFLISIHQLLRIEEELGSNAVYGYKKVISNK
jgi:enolase